MSFTVTDAFVQQFSGNVRYLAQQKASRLRPAVLEDNITGEAAYMEQLAPTTARKPTSCSQRYCRTPASPCVWASAVCPV